MTKSMLKGSQKLIEEMGELIQALAKLNDFALNGGSKSDVKKVKANIREEIADVQAGIDYYLHANVIPTTSISIRAETKLLRHIKKNRK